MAESQGAHILVVDDDARLRALIQRFLTQNGYVVSVADSAEDAQAKLQSIRYDLCVLDVMLPGRDGISLTRELRRKDQMPILLLTARGEPEDRIAGLEVGADDYLVKPFEPRELLLRIATILRRVQPVLDDGLLRFGPYVFARATAELRRGGELMHLTTGELQLLQVLAERPGRAVSRAELGERARIGGSDRAVDVQMARLRRKIEDDPRQPRYLLTMRSEGYVLRLGT
ncbi:MAG TPA: response regulator [Geminicoccaceae bacterium]|nr:response regulator [Geminicoccus sp.]HMU51579.1 response regulator [Geminicoccaceae bacterium]